MAFSSNINLLLFFSDFSGAEKYPEGAPRIRPFYWDIAKAYQEERDRNLGPQVEGFEWRGFFLVLGFENKPLFVTLLLGEAQLNVNESQVIAA